jgi:hypothetical protein
MVVSWRVVQYCIWLNKREQVALQCHANLSFIVQRHGAASIDFRAPRAALTQRRGNRLQNGYLPDILSKKRLQPTHYLRRQLLF